MARNRYVKIAISSPCSTHLQDARVVGQAADYLLLERAEPKLRAKSAGTRKPRAAKAAKAAAQVSSSPTAFPGSGVSNG